MSSTQSKQYLSCAETAKLIRTALKARWPEFKFSVRSHTYSGGASIDVGWTDGPSRKRVEAIVGRFGGASFDGMFDLKSYHDSEWQGQRVHFGADFVFCNRDISNFETACQAVELMLRRYYSPSSIMKGSIPRDDRIGNYWIGDLSRNIVYSREEDETLEEAMKRWPD